VFPEVALMPIASVVARLASILENVAVQEQIKQEQIKVWKRLASAPFFLRGKSAVAKPTL
jgi:hypothetical protein